MTHNDKVIYIDDFYDPNLTQKQVIKYEFTTDADIDVSQKLNIQDDTL